MSRSSRVIIFRFNSKTQGQMLLLVYGCHVSVPQKDTNLTWHLHTKLYKFGWHNSANNARMKQNEQQRPDSWWGCLYQSSIVSQILDCIHWMVTRIYLCCQNKSTALGCINLHIFFAVSWFDFQWVFVLYSGCQLIWTVFPPKIF